MGRDDPRDPAQPRRELTAAGERRNVSRVHAVVIDRVANDVAEPAGPSDLARALASVLGKTAYEVRPSLQVPEGGPAIVAVHAQPDAAEQTATQLRAAGFHCSAVPAKDPLPGLVVARRFELGATELTVETRDATTVSLPYAAVDVLLRGTRQTQSKQTEKVTERKLAIGRSILSGGLVNTRTETTTRTRTTTDADEFLLVFAGASVCSLREHEMQYQSLGAALQPSRTANFRHVVAELQRLCAHALRDDRLMRRSTQGQILGPMLSPDDHLELAAKLVADSLRARPPASPYR
jgi:hypothetical protein